MPESQYNLNRKGASRLLKISIRTVDRYVKNGKLSARAGNGRIWLNKEEIRQFKSRQADSGLSIDKEVDKVDILEAENVNTVHSVSTSDLKNKSRQRAGDFEIFKKLYFELKEEVSEKQNRLEMANYRVGQLEAQLKSSVPLLEYHRENTEKRRLEGEYKKQITESSEKIYQISSELKYEKFSKRIFLIILLIVLALQPLWLLITYNR